MMETNVSAATSDGLEMRMADFFKVLGCASRIHILRILLRGETSVGELAMELGLSGSSVSHQMQILKASKLVRKRRVGKMIVYSLANDSVRVMIDANMRYAEAQLSRG